MYNIIDTDIARERPWEYLLIGGVILLILLAYGAYTIRYIFSPWKPKATIPPKPTGIPIKPKTTSYQEDNKEEDETELPIELPDIKLNTNTIILLFTIFMLAAIAIVFLVTRN